MSKPIFTYLQLALVGVTLTFAYAPFSLWFIPFIALPAVFYVFFKAPQISSFKMGLAFGAGWFGAGVSWVHVSIANFGGLPLIGSLGLMALLVGYVSLFPAAAFWLTRKYVDEKYQFFGMAIFWFLLEWLRSWFMTGFPWLSLGYTQISGPLAALYPVVGETGISFLLILYGAYMARIVTRSSESRNKVIINLVATPCAVFILSLALGQFEFSRETEKSVSIAMVQGNIKQELRWAPEEDIPTMEKYLKLTEALWENDIVLWPEAAIPRLEPLAQEYLSYVDELAFKSNTGLITGIVNYNFDTSEAYNNLIVLGKSDAQQSSPQYTYQHANRYDKHHLLPIGEFIPLEGWLRGLAPIFDLPMSSFSRGDYEQSNLVANDYHFVPAICFEIAFPRQIAANLRTDSDILVTVSNDAWFGDSHGPSQHLEMAQVRAAEFGLPLIRATNNGITAFVDHKGQILSSAPQFEATTLTATLPLSEGMTPYRYWGDLPIWLIVLFGIALITSNKISRGQST